jgi:threonine/homoserine/homoserine lactone efflux protein
MQLSAAEFLSFIGIVTLLVMFPGPNTVLVMQSAGLRGKRAGFYNIAGIVTALYVQAVISAWGLSLIVLRSAALYRLIQYIGAGYIIYLGLASLYAASRMNRDDASASPDGAAEDRRPKETLSGEAIFQSYLKGFITNLFNPKVILFFISFFPQFVRRQNQVFGESLLLVVVYSLIVILWYSALVCFIAKFRHWLARRVIQRRIKTLTGLLLCGLGIKIASQK